MLSSGGRAESRDGTTNQYRGRRLLEQLVRRGPRSPVFPLQDQQHPVGSGLGLELKWPIGNAAGEIEAQFQLVSLPFVNPFKDGAFQGARFNLQINALGSWGRIDFDSELAGLVRQWLDALEGKLITLDDAFEMLHDVLGSGLTALFATDELPIALHLGQFLFHGIFLGRSRAEKNQEDRG